MNKKPTAIIIFIVVCTLGAYFLFTKETKAPTVIKNSAATFDGKNTNLTINGQ